MRFSQISFPIWYQARRMTRGLGTEACIGVGAEQVATASQTVRRGALIVVQGSQSSGYWG
jgi:hypothetical protein